MTKKPSRSTVDGRLKRVKLEEIARLFNVITQDKSVLDSFFVSTDKRELFVWIDTSTETFVRRFLATNGMLKKPAKTTSAAASASPPADRFKCF